MRSKLGLPALAAVCLALAAVSSAGSAGAADDESSGAAGWQGVLGSRPEPLLGGRWIVVLAAPSLADRVRAAGGRVDELEQREWTKAATKAQRRILTRLAFAGAPINPEQRFVRVLNAVSAALDPRLLPVLDRHPDVKGVYPVRAAYPAEIESSRAAGVSGAPAAERGIAIPGFDGGGVQVALLDTGVDLTHPFLRGRLIAGIDIADPGGDGSARISPTERGRSERHATELAGLIAGRGGPGGLRGVAPGAVVRPVRVAGWQPDGDGGLSIYARTDQILAGLESAVDPDGDGDAHDGARIALVGVVEPFAGFDDGPLGRAAAGALALDMLVIAPGGNDGPAGPAFGSVGAPAGASSVVAVAAVDSRARGPMAHVLLRAGLRVLVSGRHPLGGAEAPRGLVRASVVALDRPGPSRVGAASALERLFDRGGFSAVAGRAALLPPGPPTPEIVRDLARAGARAVIVDGPLPAGALGVSDRQEIPVLGIAASTARDVRQALARGAPVEIAVGAASLEEQASLLALAPFTSEGLALDGTSKPELAAPGVGLSTSVPGRDENGVARYGTVSGSSAAAAVVAGAAAALAHARPDLDARGLRSALLTAGRPVPVAGGAFTAFVNPAAAATVELVADPPALGLGAVTAVGQRLTQTIHLRNVSRRRLVVAISPGRTSAGVSVSAVPQRVALRPGHDAAVRIDVHAPVLPSPPSALAGVVRLRIVKGGLMRVGWAVAIVRGASPAVADAAIVPRAFKPSDTRPAVLSFTAGRVDGSLDRPQLLPLANVSIELYRGKRLLGQLTRLRDVLPGRYAFGITGRGPRGGRLPPGRYALRVVAHPVAGVPASTATVPFTIHGGK
jgi:minor extracellular serine protease Vpr